MYEVGSRRAIEQASFPDLSPLLPTRNEISSVIYYQHDGIVYIWSSYSSCFHGMYYTEPHEAFRLIIITTKSKFLPLALSVQPEVYLWTVLVRTSRNKRLVIKVKLKWKSFACESEHWTIIQVIPWKTMLYTLNPMCLGLIFTKILYCNFFCLNKYSTHPNYA